MIRTLYIVSLSILVHGLFAQTSEKLSSDRPGQSFGPLTTGQNILQIQNGLNYSQFSNSKTNDDGTTLQNFLSFRYGIWENISIRTDIAYNANETTNDDLNTEVDQKGISQWSFGVKYDILEDHPTGPAIGIIGLVDTKRIGDDFKPTRITQRIILVVSHNWTDRFSTTTNIGLNATSKGAFNNYTLNIGYSFTDDLFGFAENYGAFGSTIPGHFDNRWNGGFGYYLSNDLQLDCSAGIGKNDSVTDWFADVGVTWRIWFK